MKYVIKDDDILHKANEQYEYFNSNDQLRKLYDSYIEWKSRYKTDLDIAGEEVMEKGIKEEQRKTAKNERGKFSN